MFGKTSKKWARSKTQNVLEKSQKWWHMPAFKKMKQRISNEFEATISERQRHGRGEGAGEGKGEGERDMRKEGEGGDRGERG